MERRSLKKSGLQRDSNLWGHGFESRWSPDFSRLLLSNCSNWKIYCDDHSSLSSRNTLSQCRLELCDFSLNYIIVLSAPDFLPTKNFSSITLINNLCFPLLHNVTLTDGTTCVVRHKLGKNGPWWPLLFIAFFVTTLGREHSRKASKKLFGNLYFWGITLTKFQSISG